MSEHSATPGRSGAVVDTGLRSLARKALSLLSFRVAGTLFTLGYTLILARIAPPADFGLVMGGFSGAMLLSIGLALNVEAGAIRYLVAYHAAGQIALARGFMRFALWLISGLSLTGAALLGLLWGLGWVAFDSAVMQVCVVGFVIAPFAALTRIYARFGTALGEVVRGNLPISLVRPAVAFGLLALCWFWDLPLGAAGFMWVLCAASVVAAGVQLWLLRETLALGGVGARKAAYSDAGSWLKTGVMMAPLLVMRDNLKHVILVVAGAVLASDQLGLLALALSLMAPVYFAITAVDMALSPQISRQVQAKEYGVAAGLLRQGALLKLAGLIAGMLGALLLGGWVLAQVGEGYRAAYLPLLVLMLIPAADAVFGAGQMILNIAGQQRVVFGMTGLSVAALAVLTGLGGALGGGIGAALGAGLSYGMQQGLLCAAAVRRVGVDPSLRSLLRRRTTAR